MTKKLRFLALAFLSISSIAFVESAETPNYNEVFSQQVQCNSLYFSKAPWDKKNPQLAKMKTSTLVVISRPEITELPQVNEKQKSFRVRATVYAKYRCKSQTKVSIDFESEGVSETLVTIREAKKGLGTFDIVGNDPGIIPGSSPERIYSDFLYESGDDDKNDGFYCVALIDDFLKSANAINMDKLCAGLPVKNREVNQKYIEQDRQVLKEKLSNKKK